MRRQRIKKIKMNISKEQIMNVGVYDSFKVGIKFRDLLPPDVFYAYLKSVFGGDATGFTILDTLLKILNRLLRIQTITVWKVFTIQVMMKVENFCLRKMNMILKECLNAIVEVSFDL